MWNKQQSLRWFFLLTALLVWIAYPASAAQTPSDRFWLAGRYDGNRIVVYFDAVKFGVNGPPNPVKIAYPVADGFFAPDAIAPEYAASLQKGTDAEHFAIGDQYTMLSGGDQRTTVTLRTFVGASNDEFVGNDSYLGALATTGDPDTLLSRADYYVVTRAAPSQNLSNKSHLPRGQAALLEEPVPIDTQTRIAKLLTDRAQSLCHADMRHMVATTAPAFTIQPFSLADGSLRYYVRAEWKPTDALDEKSTYFMGAWMSTQPALHILATEQATSIYGFRDSLPILRNVVYLENGRTGLILTLVGEDSTFLKLLEYQDGDNQAKMRILQMIGAGE